MTTESGTPEIITRLRYASLALVRVAGTVRALRAALPDEQEECAEKLSRTRKAALSALAEVNLAIAGSVVGTWVNGEVGGDLAAVWAQTNAGAVRLGSLRRLAEDLTTAADWLHEHYERGRNGRPHDARGEGQAR